MLEIKRRNKPGNHNFVQLRKGYMHHLSKLTKESPAARRLLDLLVEYMDIRTNAVFATYDVFAGTLGYSRNTIAKAVRLLKQKRYISTKRLGGNTAYCVNAAIYWQNATDDRSTAMYYEPVVDGQNEKESLRGVYQKMRGIPFLYEDNDKKHPLHLVVTD